MPVTTKFDEKISEAKDKLKQAEILIVECLDPSIHGYDEMSSHHIYGLYDMAKDIKKLRDKL